eukprot:7380395-Prymnesium_polylepis.1
MDTPDTTMVPAEAAAAAAATPPVRPDLNAIAVRQKLDVHGGPRSSIGQARDAERKRDPAKAMQQHSSRTSSVQVAIGWNDEDFRVGLTKYGVAEYAAPSKTAITAPARPQIAFEPGHAADAPIFLEAPEPREMLRLM